MDLGIKNRLVLVTGAGRGIGRAIATGLAREGARVVLAARSAEQLEAVRREMKEPEQHHVVVGDLMTGHGVENLATAIEKLGTLDIMIHNLGGSAGVQQTLAPVDDWKRVWHFNVGVAHELNRRFIPHMVQRQWGRIVHISTLAATTYQGYAAYVSAKCALDGYVKTLAREFAKNNVIISAVAPGVIYVEGRYFAKLQKENPAALEDFLNNHLPIRRLGRAEEVASAVAFLCSEQASFMPGAIVAVDGGGM